MFNGEMTAGFEPASLMLQVEAVFRPLTGDICPGIDFQDADVLADVPGVLTLAALRYSNGTIFDLVVTDSAEPDDFGLVSPHIPHGAVWISSHESVTHGPGAVWELTHRLWVVNPPAE